MSCSYIASAEKKPWQLGTLTQGNNRLYPVSQIYVLSHGNFSPLGLTPLVCNLYVYVYVLNMRTLEIHVLSRNHSMPSCSGVKLRHDDSCR